MVLAGGSGGLLSEKMFGGCGSVLSVCNGRGSWSVSMYMSRCKCRAILDTAPVCSP